MSDWVALITDSHAGIRGDSEHFADYQARFYTDVFFPTCQDYGVDEVFHLGDIFDRRKYINFKTLHKYTEHFLKPLEESGMEMHLLVGNHDVALKNTNHINSPTLLLSSYENIHIYDGGPVEIELSVLNKVTLIPWINNSNYDATMEFLRNTSSNLVFGHFEFAGFEMHKGAPAQEGMTTTGFDRFDLVCSGHFHHKSRIGNIQYLGAPFEYTWSDYDDERGFHLLNKNTLELRYVRNPYTMFDKVIYSDKNPDNLKGYSPEIAGKIVKLVVMEKNNPYLFDKFLDKLLTLGAYELSVVDVQAMEVGELSDSELEESAKDTIELVYDYVDISTENQKLAVDTKKFLKELYAESLSEEC